MSEESTETVRYLYPVEVTVDLDTRAVLRVVVLDEAGVVQVDSASEEAVRIAEAGLWPVWESGN